MLKSEVMKMCSLKGNSVIRQQSKEKMMCFRWETVIEELRTNTIEGVTKLYHHEGCSAKQALCDCYVQCYSVQNALSENEPRSQDSVLDYVLWTWFENGEKSSFYWYRIMSCHNMSH